MASLPLLSPLCSSQLGVVSLSSLSIDVVRGVSVGPFGSGSVAVIPFSPVNI